MHDLFTYRYIYLIPILLSAIFSLKSFRLEWPRQYRIFSVFLMLTLLTEVFAITWKWYLHKTIWWDYTIHNLWIYNSFHILRYSLFLVFFYKMLGSVQVKKIILYVGSLIIAFGVIDFWVIQSPYPMNNYTVAFTHIFSIILSLLFFRQVLREVKIINLTRHPMVWISLGTFIYCSGSLPWFIMFNYALEFPTMAVILFNISTVLNIFLYTFYLIAFLCRPAK